MTTQQELARERAEALLRSILPTEEARRKGLPSAEICPCGVEGCSIGVPSRNIEVTGAHGCTYTVHYGGASRTTPQGVEYLCVHSNYITAEPSDDSLATLLLHLLADERAFLRNTRCVGRDEHGGRYIREPWWPSEPS